MSRMIIDHRARQSPEPPERPIPHDGGPGEILGLSQLAQSRDLSPAEALRLRALTWQPDELLERLLVLADRHADVLAVVPQDLVAVLPRYREIRDAARLAGRVVSDPTDDEIAAVDHAAAEIKATADVPIPGPESRRIDRQGRERLAAVVRKSPEYLAFQKWLDDYRAFHALLGRRAAALSAFGAGSPVILPRPLPDYVRELAAAMGGSAGSTTSFPKPDSSTDE